MTDFMIPEEAVEAAERAYETFGAGMRDALEAALPHLRAHRAPVVDREALERLAAKWEEMDTPGLSSPENQQWAQGVDSGYSTAADELRGLLNADAVLALLPTEAETKALTEVCTCRTVAPSGWDKVQQVVNPACPLRAAHTAADTPKVYFCPTAGEVEQQPGGGFDVCCDHPELHRPIKWIDLFGIDPDYGDTSEEAEREALAETATKLGYELGRKEALADLRVVTSGMSYFALALGPLYHTRESAAEALMKLRRTS